MVYIVYREKSNPCKLNSKISYMHFKIPGFWVNLQLYTAVGDRKSELKNLFFSTFYVKCGVSAPYYAVLLFKFDLTQNMAYSILHNYKWMVLL